MNHISSLDGAAVKHKEEEDMGQNEDNLCVQSSHTDFSMFLFLCRCLQSFCSLLLPV